jgi:hypothetical protein
MRSPIPRPLQKDRLSQNFVTKLPDSVTKTVVDVVIIKAVLFMLLLNMFRLLSINSLDMSNKLAEIHFQLKKKR